jgi:hypothetical protein
MEAAMSQNRPMSVLLTLGSAAFLILPIALTTYAGSQRAVIQLPNFHTSVAGADYGVTPISERKAQAVHEFKTTQI